MNTNTLDTLLNATLPAHSAEVKVANAYAKHLDTGCGPLDFENTLEVDHIPTITELFHDAGITEFTISSNYSNMMEVFYAFQTNGWQATGMRMVAAWHRDIDTNDWALVPAWHFTRA
ncbi:hypothetical protein NQ024_08005 [Corynebacterium sp. 35RC1]|nr:hypothetical protein [Corynebacterium sp. 35RC1]